MLKKLIILNGPPDSGKDTAADYLAQCYGYTKLEMKGALRKMAIAMATLAMSEKKARDLCAFLEFNREPKENLRIKQFGNRTWREFLIWISEEVCKPIFGDDVLALAAVKAVRDSGAEHVVFSDGGFQIELNTLYKHLGNLALVRVHRLDRSFTKAKDSRGYLSLPSDTCFLRSLENSDIVKLYDDLDKLIEGLGP